MMTYKDQFDPEQIDMPLAFRMKLNMVDAMIEGDEKPPPPYYATVYSGAAAANLDLTDEDGDHLSVADLQRRLALICCRQEINAVFVCVPAMGVDRDALPSEDQLKEILGGDSIEDIKRNLLDAVRDDAVTPTIYAMFFEREEHWCAVRFLMDGSDPPEFEPWQYGQSKDTPVENPFELAKTLQSKGYS